MINQTVTAQYNNDAENGYKLNSINLQLFAEGDPPAAPPAADPPPTPPADPAATPPAPGTPATPPATPPEPPANPPAATLEKYENFTLPDGSTYDQALHDQFSAVALKHGLSQESAQEFVTMYAGIRQNEQAALISEHEQRVAAWTDEAKTDPVIAKNFDKNLAEVKEVFSRFGGNEMIELLDSTGLGSHPQFIRMGMAIRAKVGEDDFPDGNSSTKDQNIGQIFFPNSK